MWENEKGKDRRISKGDFSVVEPLSFLAFSSVCPSLDSRGKAEKISCDQFVTVEITD